MYIVFPHSSLLFLICVRHVLIIVVVIVVSCRVVSCTVYMIDQIWGCGWNEHGNIGSGDQEDTLTLVPTQGVKTYTPPQLTAAYTTTTMDENTEVALAVGGAHYLVCTVPTPAPSLVGSR